MMKNLLVLILMIGGFTSFAQEQVRQREQLTPEQRNELRLKKMTLELDLNANQQKEMSKLLAQQSAQDEAERAEMKAKREKGEKLTADERFAMQSKRLDQQIAVKAQMKKILNEAQYEKWERKQAMRAEKRTREVAQHKRVKRSDRRK